MLEHGVWFTSVSTIPYHLIPSSYSQFPIWSSEMSDLETP